MTEPANEGRRPARRPFTRRENRGGTLARALIVVRELETPRGVTVHGLADALECNVRAAYRWLRCAQDTGLAEALEGTRPHRYVRARPF